MEQKLGSEGLIEIARVCADAGDEGALLAAALPALRSLAGADVDLVVDQAPRDPNTRLAGGAAPDHGGEALDAAVSMIDLAVRRFRVGAELEDLTQRVDSAQHLAGMGDYDWHIASDTNRWSDQLYRIYGYEPQSFNASYERFLANIHPDDRERIQGIHQQAYATGEPYQMIERIQRPDGEIRYLSSNGEVIMDESGTPMRMRGTCIDITERVLAEQERERIAERFRGLVETAPDAILVTDDGGHVLQANARAVELLAGDPTGRRLAEILPTRTTGGQAVPAVGLDGGDLVLDVVTAELSETDHQRRTASFLRDATPRLEREAMATRLGELQQRRRQALEINDNVVQGLSSAVYALDQEETDVAQQLIGRTLQAARNMMDDLLDPSGQHLGPGDLIRSKGATLDPHPAAAVSAEQTPPSAQAHRVLIVDDAEDIRLLLRLKIGSQAQYDVVGEAADGLDAVELARSLQPDVVLLDMAMPRMDGLQALPLIRDAVPDVRVIVLSGFNTGTLEKEALAAGADRYVVKGGPMSELLEVIAKVIDAA